LGGTVATQNQILSLIAADGSGTITVNVGPVPLGPVLPAAPSPFGFHPMSALLIVHRRQSAVRVFICQMLVIMGLVFGVLVDTSTADASEQCDAAATEFLRSLARHH